MGSLSLVVWVAIGYIFWLVEHTVWSQTKRVPPWYCCRMEQMHFLQTYVRFRLDLFLSPLCACSRSNQIQVTSYSGLNLV